MGKSRSDVHAGGADFGLEFARDHDAVRLEVAVRAAAGVQVREPARGAGGEVEVEAPHRARAGRGGGAGPVRAQQRSERAAAGVPFARREEEREGRESRNEKRATIALLR